jgi:hypothetical protein
VGKWSYVWLDNLQVSVPIGLRPIGRGLLTWDKRIEPPPKIQLFSKGLGAISRYLVFFLRVCIMKKILWNLWRVWWWFSEGIGKVCGGVCKSTCPNAGSLPSRFTHPTNLWHRGRLELWGARRNVEFGDELWRWRWRE